MDYSNDNADNTFAGSASSTGLCWTWASLSTADGERRNDSSRIGMDDSLITELAKLVHKTSSETAITLNEHVRRVDSLLHIVAEKPELCQLQDYHGLLPLHVAVENNVPLELIRLLVQAHPAGTVVKYVNEIGITTVLRRATTVTMFDYLLDETMRYLSWTREQSGWSAIQIFFQYHYDMDAVVQRLVDELPGFLKERYEYLTAECFSRGFFSQLPLHLAVEMNAPIKVLMMLVLRYEKALSEKTHEGNTPLNLACCVGHVEPPMIRLLATSASVRAFNGVGKLPLHNYCDRSRQDYVLDSQVIEMLVNLFPNSVRTTAPSGQTALHLACKGANADDIEAIRLLVQFCPQTLHMTDCQDYTPLRCLCLLAGGEQSLPVTRFVTEVSPRCVEQLDQFGYSTLHWYLGGVHGQVLLSVVKLLVDAKPAVLRVKDRITRRTPLHMACDNCIDLDVVRFLVEQCPEVLESSGTETPLHTLCVNLTSPRVIASYARNLFHTLAVSKKAVETRDSQGRTALHLLVEQNAPREFVEFVIECSPDVAQVKDAAGQTPLHVAIRGCAAATGSNVPIHEDVMRCLLGAYPLAVNTVDNNGMTPLMLACERDAPLSVIYRLVRVDPFCNHSLDWSQVSLPADRAGEPISYWRRTLSAVKGLLF